MNPHNRFLAQQVHTDAEFLEYCLREEEAPESNKTRYLEVFPKTIVNPVNSPDIGFNWSANPYQGCEHGCVYCYARPTHEYWGYSAGTDFEQVVLVKKNAAELLEATFDKKSWTPELVVLSGATDCYQPAERHFGITRDMLKVFLKYRHPVGLITKNSLILRDLDLLKDLNAMNLLRVTLSITTLDEGLRRSMEPRTASVQQRLKALEILSKAGIAVNVNMAPVIPGLNSHELFDVCRTIAERGARSAAYMMVRLNGPIGGIFEEWIAHHYPDRAGKVLSIIRETHGGELSDSRFRLRMRGEGEYAGQINRAFKLACRKYGLNSGVPQREPVCCDLFERPEKGQLRLF